MAAAMYPTAAQLITETLTAQPGLTATGVTVTFSLELTAVTVSVGAGTTVTLGVSSATRSQTSTETALSSTAGGYISLGSFLKQQRSYFALCSIRFI